MESLLLGNRRFRERFADRRDDYLRLAEEGQSPAVLWIGCSDSRVIPEQIVSAEAGELFVLRNIANVVPPYGTSGDTVGAVIEYAVLHLRVGHIVICGHTQCGGIQALESHLDSVREPHLARWVEWARPAYTHVASSGVPEEARYLETIKANVLLQRDNLRTYPCVREAVGSGHLTLHAWLYDLHTGGISIYDDETATWRTPE